MSGDLKRKRSVRKGHRSYAINTNQVVVDLLNSSTVDASSKANDLKKHRITLKERLDILKSLDEDIICLVKESEIEHEINEAGKFREGLHEILVKIDNFLSSNPASTNSSSNAQSPSKNIHAKLPKLEIAKFGGDPTTWLPFWDSFESSIDRHIGLDKIEKFNYLKSFLEKEALATVSGLPLTADNYESAKRLLCERFGNKQVLISSHMEGMYKLNTVYSIHDIKHLRQLYDKLEGHIRALQTLKVESKSYGSLLIPLLMDKLPSELRLVISRNMENDVWELDKLLDNLKTELEARERCSQIKVTNVEPRPSRGGFVRGINVAPQSSSALIAQGGSTVKCTYCRANHSSAQCMSVQDITARIEILKRQGRCFLCLGKGHMSRDCPRNIKCFQCSGYHHVSICKEQSRTSNEQQQYKFPTRPQNFVSTPQRSDLQSPLNKDSNNPKPPGPQRSTAMYTDSETSVLLQTALARVASISEPNKATTVRILFDSGSQRSYVSQRIKEKLNLVPIRSEHLIIKSFGQENEQSQSCDVVQMSIEGLDDRRKTCMTAFTVPLICSPLHNQVIHFAQGIYPHLRDIQLADNDIETSDSEIDILIGSDCYWNFVTGRIKKGRAGPVAIETNLGWVLSGSVEHPSDTQTRVNLSTTHVLKVDTQIIQEKSNLSNELSNFWESEETDNLNIDEDPIYNRFVEEIQFTGERYKVKLPFKDEYSALELPDNLNVCQKRFTCLLKRLRAQPDMLERYDKVIKDQLDDGKIERVNVNAPTGDGVHYLPHHGVVREDKDTSKLRVVYDGSSKDRGTSINENLHSGPALNPVLSDILIRFRAHKVALSGDIQQAFLNVEVHESQRDFLRFLWIKDIHDKEPEQVTYRFCRVVFGLTCSPFLLNATIRHHVSNYEPKDSKHNQELLNSLYVDDYLCSFPNLEEAQEAYSHVKGCLKDGGFNMRKWKTNSSDLLKLINEVESPVVNGEPTLMQEDETTYSKSDLKENTSKEVKILGISWNTDTDKLTIDFKNVLQTAQGINEVTKRTILSLSASIYDPIGLISPVVVVLRIIFQDLCKENVLWDDLVDETVRKRFYKVINSMQRVQCMSVDRQYTRNIEHKDIESVQIHGFSDASFQAYGACVYLRVQSKTGEVACTLVASKARVAPLGGSTIPRLELVAAVCLARLIERVKQALKGCIAIQGTYCWSDSQVVLWWILGENKNFKTYVMNRVTEIRRLTPISSWNYCPSEQNPADLASRGCEASNLMSNDKWWHGPEYLSQDESLWPKNRKMRPENLDVETECCELKKEDLKDHTLLNVSTSEPSLNLENIVALENFSSMSKLLRVTCYVLRFIKNARKTPSERSTGTLSQEELLEAEIKWIISIQQKLINQDNYKQLTCSLGLFEDDDGIIRCRGRLENAPLNYDTRFPILLPHKHRFANLLVMRCHIDVKHNGLKETLNHLRSRFWITRGRQIVKGIISRCAVCKRIEGKGYRIPAPSPLPEFRLNYEFAFSKIGIDFAGPLYVKDIYKKEKEMHKCYIVLFTCACTRAIHLELAPDLR